MRVGLFIPCYIDQFYPQVAQCIVDGLRENQSYNEIAACTRRDGKKSAMDTWGTGSKHMLAVIEKFSKNPNVARKIDMEMD